VTLSLIPRSVRQAQLSRIASARLAPVSAPARDTRALVNDQGWQIVRGDQPTQFQGTGRDVRILGFERHPVVQACARIITDIAGSVPLEVYRKSQTGSADVTPNVPAALLLEHPRIGMTALQLRILTALHVVLYGNAIWVLERAGPRAAPASIRLVHPEMVQYVYLDPTTHEIIQYDWRDRLGVTHTSLATDVCHFKDLAGGDWLFGYPRAASALLDITGDSEASQYTRQIITNQGLPSAVVQVKGAVGRDELTAAEERWQEKMVRRGNRGRVVFMAGVEKVVQMAFNMRDMEFTALRNVAREDICAAFQVDPRMVGVTTSQGKGATFSGVEYREARFRLIQTTVIPLMALITAVLDDWYCPEFGDVYARFSPDGLSELTEDEAATSTRTLAEWQGSLITREEARRRIGEEETPKATDTLAVPTTTRLTTVADAITPPAPPRAALGADPAVPDVGDGAADPNAAPAPKPAPPAPPSRFIRAGVALTDPQRKTLWAAFDASAERQEGPFRTAALLRFAAERDAVASMFGARRRRRAIRAGDPTDAQLIAEALALMAAGYADDGEFTAAWGEAFTPLVGASLGASSAAVAASIGLDWSLTNPLVTAAIRARVNTLAGGVTETTYEQIQAVVEQARAAGLGIRDIANAIRETVFSDEITMMRATRIARTETIGAMNAGEMLAAMNSRGALRSKEWLTQEDAKVRDSHAAQDRVRRDLTQAFPNGLQYPGDQNGSAAEVINCRCTLLYSDLEAPA